MTLQEEREETLRAMLGRLERRLQASLRKQTERYEGERRHHIRQIEALAWAMDELKINKGRR